MSLEQLETYSGILVISWVLVAFTILYVYSKDLDDE